MAGFKASRTFSELLELVKIGVLNGFAFGASRKWVFGMVVV